MKLRTIGLISTLALGLLAAPLPTVISSQILAMDALRSAP